MAEVKAEKLWEGGLGGSFLDRIAHNTHSIGWDKNEVTHVAVSPSFYMVVCRTERREGGKDRDVLNQWLWSCLPCTGALVFVSSVAFSKQAGSPGVDNNAWRVLGGLEIFPPFSAQEKAATNPSSFLTPGPWFALCFHDNLSLSVWSIWMGTDYLPGCCPLASCSQSPSYPPRLYPKPPEQITTSNSA